MSTKLPKVIFGSMTIGVEVAKEENEPMVLQFLEAGYKDMDTAYVYGEGKTEEVMGTILSKLDRDTYTIAAKANPTVHGHFRKETVIEQLETSLSRLGIEYADILYLHRPHPATPIEDTLEGCASLHEQGKFRELGLSNYSAWETAHIWHLCEKQGLVKPTVYQGMYNAITRDVERELFPCLRTLGMSFYAYNPLAGGMLTGKHRNSKAEPTAGRFERQEYRGRYWLEEHFNAVSIISEACGKTETPMAQAALRWLAYHSLLEAEAGDGIIVGASSMAHLKDNLAAFQQKELPREVVEAYDEAWEIVRPVCPKYFRP
jgi:aflatoxin B1 aldehyde reductase